MTTLPSTHQNGLKLFITYQRAFPVQRERGESKQASKKPETHFQKNEVLSSNICGVSVLKISQCIILLFKEWFNYKNHQSLLTEVNDHFQRSRNWIN